MENVKQQQPLLAGDNGRNNYTNLKQFPAAPENVEAEDRGVEINGVKDFCREFYVESKKLWYLAGPAIFTSICQYTVGATTQLFAGQLGTMQLAAVSVENSVIGGFSFSILFGMGSALETLCGQAYGAGKFEMLGVYLQRSWVVLNTIAVILMFTYIFGVSVLRLLRQTPSIATAAGRFSVWMIPQLFAYATLIPIAKFLQAQSNIMPMAWIALVAVVSHVFLSWLLMMKLGWGLVGAAVVLDCSWWFMTVAQLTYVLWGSCGQAWGGFSWEAFHNLKGFVRVSFATAVMFCLENWYLMSLVLFAGYFENAEASVDALSVCLNILGWICTVALGLNVACKGVERTRLQKAENCEVRGYSRGIDFSSNWTPLHGGSSSVQKTIPGVVYKQSRRVAIGAGWQTAVAYMNVGSYFFFGIPMSLLMGFRLDMGVKGIWYGMVSGATMQCCLLLIMVSRTNWNEEVNIVGHRIKQWGGDIQQRSIH
ncbi:Multi antimicrobial extrusion protein [Cynara cardunculus var. scolymus]|uniref:Protein DETOXIFICATION n=1 Tax=Cynara cardunculus var. scolymus TaxID=59895 RepID=A0A103XRN6_CYNCS|nr:Multi antimicrobial extrusion protein [Cynara cardunculus var. scolymus]